MVRAPIPAYPVVVFGNISFCSAYGRNSRRVTTGHTALDTLFADFFKLSWKKEQLPGSWIRASAL